MKPHVLHEQLKVRDPIEGTNSQKPASRTDRFQTKTNTRLMVPIKTQFHYLSTYNFIFNLDFICFIKNNFFKNIFHIFKKKYFFN